MIIIFILISVRFYTLLERKLLRLSQLRLGPNKQRFYGILQPILDGLKLFKKTERKNHKIYFYFFSLRSIFILRISFIFWRGYPFKVWINKTSRFFWILILIGLMRFFILILGWRSFNKYSLLGSLRRISQIISLEVLTVIIMVVYLILLNKRCLSLREGLFWGSSIFLIFIYFVAFLIEVQRTPFDTAEGERELVRGYNTEFRALFFVFIFLSEYINILFFSGFIAILIRKSWILWAISMQAMLLTRACFPRVRYDFLIEYAWLKILPLTICLAFIISSIKFL